MKQIQDLRSRNFYKSWNLFHAQIINLDFQLTFRPQFLLYFLNRITFDVKSALYFEIHCKLYIAQANKNRAL